MRTDFHTKALLAVAFLMTFSFPATANPITCTPKVALAPSEGESRLGGFFQRLVQGSEQPQPFSGAVMEDPDPICSLGLDTRPVAVEPVQRTRREALN